MDYVNTVTGSRVMEGASSDSRTFESEVEVIYDSAMQPPKPRNQIVTSSGNHVQATPYVVVFDNGAHVLDVGNGSVSLKEVRTGGSGANEWQETIKAEVTRHPPSSLFPRPTTISKPVIPAGLVAESETKALANLRRGYYSAPMMVKEMPSNIRMIEKRTIGLLDKGIAAQRDALAKLEKANYKNRGSVARRAAELHLEYLFGWMPLINDIEGIIRYVGRRKTLRITGRGRASRRSTVSLPGASLNKRSLSIQCPYNETTGWTTVQCRESGVRRSEMIDNLRCRSSLTVELETQFGGSYTNNGLNPVDFAFDAVPLSFLLNFSTNIQDYLTALSPRASGKFITGCSTTYLERKYSHKITAFYDARIPQGTATWVLSPPMRATVVQDGVYIDRKVLATEPEPELILRNMMDVSRMATAASLAIALKGKTLSRLIRKRAFYTSKL